MARKKKISTGRRQSALSLPDFGNLVVVEQMANDDPEFARLISMAHANGLPRSMFGEYANCYNDCLTYDVDCMITMTLPLEGETVEGKWQEWLDETHHEFTKVMMGDYDEPDEPEDDEYLTPKKKARKKALTDEVAPPANIENVTAKEGDAYRRVVRATCEENGWDLTEKGPAIEVRQGSEVVAMFGVARGKKPLAWWEVYQQLEILK